MTDCEHLKFEASVNVTRLTHGSDETFIGNLALDVAAHCKECEMPVRFVGLSEGVVGSRPTTSVDHREARLRAVITLG